MTRAIFVLPVLLAVVAASQRPAAFDVTEKTILELQAALSTGRVTSAQLVEAYLARIRALDQNGPRLNAVIFVNPNAVADARALDAERRKTGPRGPLHGIPVLLKDNFETRDMPTTGGSLALMGIVPKQDAFQVARLRRAGAVLLGKLNLHELALGLTTVSSLGGQTLNPYDLRRAPGGSSGGSGVAVAANLATFALGTDTSGSIRIPSSHNNIVGLRPTAGLSSRAGIIPFGHTQDTGGPMARTVADIAAVLDATVGFDPADPITSAGATRVPQSYAASLRAEALRDARVGVLDEYFGDSPDDAEVARVVRRAVEDMKTQGSTAVSVAIAGLGRLTAASNLLTQELKFDLREYLRRSPAAPIKSLEDLLASGLHTAQFQAFIEGANALPDDYPNGADYKARLAARAELAAAVVRAMDEQRLDVIVYPTVRRVAPLVGGNQAGSNAGLSAQSGLPAISVPAGFTPGGFPVGVELLGRPFAEPTLLALAYAYEQATRHRRPPSLVSPPAAQPGVAATGGAAFTVTATGAQAVPPAQPGFEITVRFALDGPSRRLAFDVRPGGRTDDIAGVYLHRRFARPVGGVIHRLRTAPAIRGAGSVTLTEAEVEGLKDGKLYVAALSRADPRRGARADLRLPPPGRQ